MPEFLLRWSTGAAIASLAERFGLPDDPSMQDWELEVADASRVGEFVDAYTSGELSDDERFTLMELILFSSEGKGVPLAEQERWPQIVELLRRHVELHAHTIYYWSCVDAHPDDDVWDVTPYLRQTMADAPQAFQPRER